MSTYYRIRAGKIENREIPFDGIELKLAVATCSYRHRRRAMPGQIGKDLEWSVRQVAEIADKLTPWATWHLAPDFVGLPDSFGAEAHGEVGHVCQRTYWGPGWMISTAYHEAYHALESRGVITPEHIEIMNRAVSRGIDWPDPDYYASAIERRARLFQHYAASYVEGRRAPRLGWLARRAQSPEERLMTDILDGKLTAAYVRKGYVPSHLRSASWNRFLNERTATQKLIDAGMSACRRLLGQTSRAATTPAPAASR